jgi:hypothetical protein
MPEQDDVDGRIKSGQGAEVATAPARIDFPEQFAISLP